MRRTMPLQYAHHRTSKICRRGADTPESIALSIQVVEAEDLLAPFSSHDAAGLMTLARGASTVRPHSTKPDMLYRTYRPAGEISAPSCSGLLRVPRLLLQPR
jgi:hypothetical protein